MTIDINQRTAQSNLISVIFLHHSTGANLIKDGNVRKLFQQRAPFIAFWDHGYDAKRRIGKSVFTSPLQSHIYGLRDATGRVMPASFHVPNNNTNPDGLAELFSQSVTNPPVNALSHILQFNVVIFKSCFPVTAIASDEQLRTYQKYYLTIRDVIDKYRDKLFIPMTPPPLRASMTNAEMSGRARKFSNWIMSEDYHEQRPHLKPYDFFSQLATPEIHPQANTLIAVPSSGSRKDRVGARHDPYSLPTGKAYTPGSARGTTPTESSGNALRPEFCRSNPSDSHPNVQANRTVALHWVSFVIEASTQAAFLTRTSDNC